MRGASSPHYGRALCLWRWALLRRLLLLLRWLLWLLLLLLGRWRPRGKLTATPLGHLAQLGR